MKSITLTVPQGLGDIFWIYRLYAKRYDVINFTIGILNEPNEIQLRAVDWLYTLPKVGNVGWVRMGVKPYHAMISYEGPLLQEDGVYACNAPLEKGKRLEEIGDVQWDVKVYSENGYFKKGYICLYVSGNAKMNHIEGQWQDYEWVEFINLFYKKYKLKQPLKIIGAEYDREMVEYLHSMIPRSQSPLIQQEPALVLSALESADFFIGYQSGLGIMADNLDTPQLMMYFHKYKKLSYSWCKPKNIRTKFFADTFDRSPKQVVEGLRWKP